MKAIRPNLIITGFMGTGKTAVGTVVARRLGRGFVDMDSVIEERLGLTIPEIFARFGEPYFRSKESELVKELAASSGKVVATGGGTLISDANRMCMAVNGIIVNLRCSLEETLNRLEKDHHRPLIEGEDKTGTIVRLLQERQPQYDKIAWQVDTTSLTIDEAADRIVAGYLLADAGSGGAGDPQRIAPERPLDLKRFTVDWPYGGYQVIFGRGISGQVGRILREARMGSPVVLVTTAIVGQFYANWINKSLTAAGFVVHHVEMPDGERHKNLDTVNYLYERFMDARIDRSSTVVTLGGGVVSDTAGYAAATYMRGVPLVHIPTTLVAQVDASIGGKVGVDHARGKNLIGTFFAPRFVVIDPLLLRSLPDSETRAGSAEVVKTAMIRSAELFDRLERNRGEITDDIVWECARIKADVVSRDPFETGERAILNFGHTIGHAIESASEYLVGHGEAVSIGMVAAARMAVEMGICEPSVEERLGGLLRNLLLPVNVEGLEGRLPESAVSIEAAWEAMRMDKKRREGRLRFVLPSAIGSVVVSDEVPEEVVHKALAFVLCTGGLKLGSSL